MANHKHASRLNLSFCAHQIAKKTGMDSWFGVQQVLLNDKRWRTLDKHQKMLPELMLIHCDLSGLTTGTFNRLQILIDAAGRTNNNISKMIKLLVKPNAKRKFTEIIISKRNSGKHVPLMRTDSCIKSELSRTALKPTSSRKNVYSCNNKKALQIAIHESLKCNRMQKKIELINNKIEPCVKSCAICTFDNHVAMSYCEICGFTFG